MVADHREREHKEEIDLIAAEMRAKGYVPTWNLYDKNVEFDKFGRAWRFKAFVPDVAKYVVV